jgi:hypothetical protein
MKTIAKTFAFGALLAAVAINSAGCGGGGGKVETPAGKTTGPKTATGEAVTQVAADAFNVAIEAFAQHEAALDWNDAICADVAKKFDAAVANQKGKFPEATFNAGLV